MPLLTIKYQNSRYLARVDIKNKNVMINGRNIFDQPIKKDLISYGKIQKNSTCWRDDYTTGCLLDYHYSRNYYKMMLMHLMRMQKQYRKLILLEI